MELEALKQMLLKKTGAAEDYPFGPGTMVIRVRRKMFALVGVDAEPLRVNLKCDPDDAQVLRTMYTSVKPGYHMNKEHWNTVILDGDVPAEILDKMIDESWRLVVSGLSRKNKDELNAQH